MECHIVTGVFFRWDVHLKGVPSGLPHGHERSHGQQKQKLLEKFSICGEKLDFRKKGVEHDPIYINKTEVERVKSIMLPRVTITDDLSWTSHVDATVKKAQQCIFILRRPRKFGMSIRSLTNFYRCTIES
eukprot:g24178.t1